MPDLVRRRFLLGAGLALPMLESVLPPAVAAPAADLERFVAIGSYLGFHRKSFNPQEAGSDYQVPAVLAPLAPFRGRMSILSGLDHRGRSGHLGWKAWMSGSASGALSVDQLVAAHIGRHTRHDSLQVTCGTPPDEARISFTKEGVALPMIGRPSVLYKTLFRSRNDNERLDYVLSGNHSVLDGALDEARRLQQDVSAADRTKLGEYFASVRDVEKKIQKQRAWLDKPTPRVDYPLPRFDPVAPDLSLECETIMYDLAVLALTTDSTRVLTFAIPGWSQVFTLNGRRLSAGYHGLSHHGNEPRKIAEYNLVGTEHVQRFAGFLRKLDAAQDAQGRGLLDTTAVVFGSGMGDSNTHDNSNLPTLVVGGPLRHGQHHRVPREQRLLGDLYLTLMQKLGVEIESFAGAKSNLNEILA